MPNFLAYQQLKHCKEKWTKIKGVKKVSSLTLNFKENMYSIVKKKTRQVNEIPIYTLWNFTDEEAVDTIFPYLMAHSFLDAQPGTITR